MFSIVVADRIELGPGAVIDPLTLVYRPSFFSMGERSRIAGFVRIIGYGGNVSLGQQSFVALSCLIDISADFELGNRSAIGPRSTLYSHGSTGLIFNIRYPHRIGKIKIGVDTWIGMCCIIHPQVSIGDRVIVLPGIVVRSNIPDDTSIIAPAVDQRSIPTNRLLIGVTDEVRRKTIDMTFQYLTAHYRDAVVDQTDPEIWRLELNGRRTVYLLRTDTDKLSAAKLRAMDTVIWTMFECGVVPGVPCFCFDRLTIFGPWTPFAEQVAAFLLCDLAVNFVFEPGAGASPKNHSQKESHEAS